MKTNEPKLIVESNLSIAWARAFLHVYHNENASCLTVALRDFDTEIPPQDMAIATALDKLLAAATPAIPTINQTALTIVPYERWLRKGKPDLAVIKDWYINSFLPRLKARCTKNRHGTYFERLIAYTGVKSTEGKYILKEVNQLEYVINFWRKSNAKGRRPRQSALQLTCFDPAKDDNGAALAGFPCLQQISLTYKESGSLEINAYYPTQYMIERAYGNYLGLCQLGHFIAHHLGVRLSLTPLVWNRSA